MFQKAVKYDAKLRLALCGPAGSGKTYSLLALATELGGPIAYIDTEHGSASKYADLFSFDVIEPAKFDPRDLIEALDAAIKAGYKVFCIDSLSHYWMGVGGELEIVDAAAKKSQSGNSFAAWKTVTPIHNKLIDSIIAAPIHVLVSMRTKTEWVIETNDRGKQVPRKVGLAPVMRDGIEFEFDVCGDLDQDNNLVISKSRCPALSGQVINRPGRQMAETLKAWLTGAPAAERPVPPPPAPSPERKPAAAAPKPAAPPTPPAPPKIGDDDLPQNLGGTWQDPDQRASADRHIEETKKRLAQTQQEETKPVAPVPAGAPAKPWTNFKGMLAAFAAAKERFGAFGGVYYSVLRDVGKVEHANAFRSGDVALETYRALEAELAKMPVGEPEGFGEEVAA